MTWPLGLTGYVGGDPIANAGVNLGLPDDSTTLARRARRGAPCLPSTCSPSGAIPNTTAMTTHRLAAD